MVQAVKRFHLALIPVLSVACIVAAVAWWLRLPPGPPRLADTADLDPLVLEQIEAAVTAVRAEPRSALLRRKLGMVYEANGMRQLASICYRQLVELDADDARSWYRLAQVAQTPEEVRNALERVIELEPGYAPARWRLGFLELQSGRTQPAETAFARCLEVAPESAAARVGMARLHLEQDQPAEALALLDEALATDPDLGQAHLQKAATLRALGRLEEAEKHMVQAVAADGARQGFDDPWSEEVRAYRTGFNAALRAAEGHLSAGRIDQAVVTLETLRRHAPDHVAILNDLGLAYVAAGRADEAIEAVRAGLAVEPESPALLVTLSMAYERKGDLGGALASATRAITAGPAYGPAYKQAGLVLGRMRRYEQAVEKLERAAHYMPDDQICLVRLGHAQGNLKRWSDAAATFERVCGRFPDSVDALAGLAVARLELGDEPAARDAWTRARALGATVSTQPPSVRDRLAALEETPP
jgi:tetratricopeptide (TPR) repeat protein